VSIRAARRSAKHAIRHCTGARRAGISCAAGSRGGIDVTQRSIEILIGRLVTDEAFRDAFAADRDAALARFVAAGHDLTPLELALVRSMAAERWRKAAAHVDPRLQKANLSTQRKDPGDDDEP
jgi:hypothetical protein